ncbi:MAG: aminotransferase class I/II-fold pyridoxal phosphate-dependent enzyme [Planctomycetota bacterium]
MNIPVTEWIADRADAFDASGIRKVFDLAASLKNPINLSIGQPDFDVPEGIQDAAIDAIRAGKNGYSPTQGIPPLRDALRERIGQAYDHADRDVFICSGTSGGLTVAMWSLVNPSDEVIFQDPYFLMYPPLLKMCGGVPVPIDSYPDFTLDVDRIAAAITPKTKIILVNSPGNPTGVCATRQQLCDVAELAAEKNLLLVSDEIYSRFLFDDDFISPAQFNDQTLVIDGFSKSHSMTGWRVGYAHGPSEIISTMMKIQQYSYVCAPQPAQWGAVAAMDIDLADHIADYRRKRDFVFDRLQRDYEVAKPGGAFYFFPKVPGTMSATEFVQRAIEHELMLIPGKIFSGQDTHFRLSFAADDNTLDRGMEVLAKLAKL